MPELVTFDENSRIFRVCLYKAADGTPLTGLTFESTALIISTIADVEATATAYPRVSDKIEDITTLGTYAAPTATKCRFKEVDATNHPGLYEIHLADARLSVASAKSLLVTVSGYSTLAVCNKLIPLTRLDLQAAKVTLDNTAHGGAAASLNLAGGTAFGATTMGTLTQTGAASLGAGSTVTCGAFTVTGATTFTGAVAYTSTETHTGAVAHNGGITTTTWAASGAVTLATTLAVSGTTTLAAVNAGAIGATSITLSGTLQAATITSTGATTFNSLVVSTTSTFTGATTHTGAVSYVNGITVAGGTSTHGLTLTGAASGHGISSTGGTGNTHGIYASGIGTGSGIVAICTGTGNGIYAVGDDTGMGILAVGGDASSALTAGIFAKSLASANPKGLYVEDGATITSDYGTGLLVSSTGGNGKGLHVGAAGTGAAVLFEATANAPGLYVYSQSSDAVQISGFANGIEIDAANGNGIDIDGSVTGINVLGGSGPGIVSEGTSGLTLEGNAASAFVAASTGGDGHGFELSGNGTGSGLNASSFKVTGLTTHTGNVLHSGTTTYVGAFTLTGAVLTGTVDGVTFTSTTTEFESPEINSAVADNFIGRVIVFTSGATIGQACTITDYAKVGSNGHFTVSTLTNAPANGVTFNIY